MTKLAKRIQIGWQVFQRRETFADHWSKHDTYMELVQYDALCAHCGKAFLAFASKSNWRKKQVRRRCDRHKKGGAWVDNLKPPIKPAAMPWWARPIQKLVKKTASTRRYAAKSGRSDQVWLKRSARSPGASKRTAGTLPAPDLSYLD